MIRSQQRQTLGSALIFYCTSMPFRISRAKIRFLRIGFFQGNSSYRLHMLILLCSWTVDKMDYLYIPVSATRCHCQSNCRGQIPRASAFCGCQLGWSIMVTLNLTRTFFWLTSTRNSGTGSNQNDCNLSLNLNQIFEGKWLRLCLIKHVNWFKHVHTRQN